MRVFGIGLPICPAPIDLIVHKITFWIPLAFNLPVNHRRIYVGFGQQTRTIFVGAFRVLNRLGVARRVHIGHDDERGIGPAFHELPIHQIVLQYDMAPS